MMKLPVTFDRYGSRADGSIGLTFTTALEATTMNLEEIHAHVRSLGWLLFSEQELQDKDIPEEEIEESKKTPSQRLRGVMFLYWKKHKAQDGIDFETYRRGVFEKWIESFKDRLD